MRGEARKTRNQDGSSAVVPTPGDLNVLKGTDGADGGGTDSLGEARGQGERVPGGGKPRV